MESACGRYVLVFNGEIYNHREIRRELEKPSAGEAIEFRGHSDTEAILAAFSRWGVEESLELFNGMFALAVWDRAERKLSLARDRMGEKPLYYGYLGRAFIFASELKAMQPCPGFTGRVDRDALALFLRHGYVPSPYCIYAGIHKLPPACLLTLKIEALRSFRSISPFPDTAIAPSTISPMHYWSLRDAAEQGAENPLTLPETEVIARLDTLLRDAVKLRMEADVPLGAFLSGGIDSSTVVALMQAQSDRPVRTFSIGFFEAGMNEADYAKAVARHLGTDHVELYVTPEQTMEVIPRLPDLYDEPFADSSQIPTFLVSQLSREHVTVSLSGDGGDELFCGYDRYHTADKLWPKIARAPLMLRRAASRLISAIPVEALNSTGRWIPLLTRMHANRRGPIGQSLHALANILPCTRPEELYLAPMSHWQAPTLLVDGARELPTALTDQRVWADLPDFMRWMMYVDAKSYLPDDILVKVDRASMGVSLEARVPFLDHRVVEFSWRVPVSLNVKDGKGKWLVRQVLRKYVPVELVERPKMGFGVPIDVWLRGPLRDWAESLLDESRLETEGFLNPKPIREEWSAHLSGRGNRQNLLWDVLMFQAWVERNRNSISFSN